MSKTFTFCAAAVARERASRIESDPLAALQVRINEQECLLAQIYRHLEVLGKEMMDLSAEEERMRNGESWFLNERVTSLRMRQVKCTSCLAQTAKLYETELKNERGLIYEYDCVVAEVKAKAITKADKRKALPRTRRFIIK
jgi:hypothetical protein